jgi:hypothetical protein
MVDQHYWQFRDGLRAAWYDLRTRTVLHAITGRHTASWWQGYRTLALAADPREVARAWGLQ